MSTTSQVGRSRPKERDPDRKGPKTKAPKPPPPKPRFKPRKRVQRLVDLAAKFAREAGEVGSAAHALCEDHLETGHGRGRPVGSVSTRSSRVWCDRHESDRCQCTDKVTLPEWSDPVGDAVATAVTQGRDAVRDEARRQLINIEFLERAVAQNLVDLMHAYRSVAGLAMGDIQVPPEVRRPSLGGDCLACERYVPGTPSDRLRLGLCEACRKAWTRARAKDGTLERQVWILKRRKELAERVEEDRHVDPKEARR